MSSAPVPSDQKPAAGVADTFADVLPHLRSASQEARNRLKVEATTYFLDIIEPNERLRIRISRRNAVFIADMMNSFSYFFESVEPIQVSINGIQYALADFSTPRYHMVTGFADFPILCPTITEPFVTAQQYLDVARFQPGQTVLDLGAYCGLTAICFSKAVGPSGRVIAVEPDPSNFDAAKKNIRLHERINRLSNVSLVAKAVSAQPDKLRFSGEGTMGSSALSIVGLGRGDDIFVETISLLGLTELFHLEKVDFVKMDIEGSEDSLLKGSAEFFEVFRPRMIIEPHLVGGVLVADSVMSTLQGYGYASKALEQYGASLPLIVAEPIS